MNSATISSSAVRPTTDHERRLCMALRANAASSGTCGLIGLIFADQVVEFLGDGTATLVRLVAGGLVGFALFVAMVSTMDTRRMHRETLVISAGDIVWVAASIVVVALGLLTTGGTIAALIVGVMVGDFAVLQLWTRAKISAV